jgi:hypothetical protein
MANQMVALQARAPQGGGLGPAIAQGAQMINMMAQQRAAERQAAQAQQAMDIQAAQEARAATIAGPQLEKAKADALAASLDVNAKQAQLVKRDLAVIRSGDLNAITNWRQRATQLLPEWAEILPSAEEIARDRNTQLTIASVIDQIINKEIASPVASLGFTEPTAEDPNSYPVNIVVGGPTPGITRIGERVTPTTPRGAPTTPQPSQGGSMEGPPMVEPTFRGENPPLSEFQKDHLKRLEAELGITSTPASFTRGGMGAPNAGQMTPDMAQTIYDSAISTGVMAQVDFDQLLAMAPPQNRQAFVNMLQREKITLEPNAPSLAVSGAQTPQPEFAVNRNSQMQPRFAVNRDEPVQQTLAQSGEYRPIVLKRPTPPGANVAPEVLGSQKAAETQATKNVELRMAPQIAAATKQAERAVERRSEALVAKNEAKILVQNLDNYINTIDELLRSPDRHKIVGRIEGNLHYLGSLGQNERQAELQAMYDRIKNTDTLTSLVAMKQASPSGGSPVGNASNQDVQLVARGANALTQTGGVPKFDEELKKLRRQAYRARQNAIEFYGDRYGELTAEDPKFKLNVSPIADRYINPKDLRSRRKPPIESFGGR